MPITVVNLPTHETIPIPKLLPVEKELTTTEGAKNYSQRAIKESFAAIKKDKTKVWFATSENPEGNPEAIQAIMIKMLKDYNDVSQKGGEIGGQEYLLLDDSVTAHNERHVNIQVALAVQIATQLALSDQANLPQGVEGEFKLSDWMEMVTTALVHEAGFLREKTNGPQDQLPCVYLASEHEKRGAQFAENFHQVYGLDLFGISLRSLQKNILATELSARTPKKLETWSDLSKADLTHFIDLAAWAVDPLQVPDGVESLREEILFSTKGLPSPLTTESVNWIDSGFMLSEGSNFGQEVKDLIDKIPDDSELVTIYHRNQERFRAYRACRLAEKKAETRLSENSCDPSFLWRLASEFDCLEVYQQNVTALIQQRHEKGSSLTEQLPTWMFKELEKTVPPEKKSEFWQKVFQHQLQQAKSQNVQGGKDLIIQATPMAGELISSPEESQLPNPQMMTVAFKQACQAENIQATLEIVLRREDTEINQSIVESYFEAGIDQFMLGGFEELTLADRELVDTIHNKGGHVAVVWGQVEAKNYAEIAERIKQEWGLIKDRLKPGDRIVYPQALLKDYQEIIDDLLTKMNQGLQVEFSIAGALAHGYQTKEIVEFIRDFALKCSKTDCLRIVSGTSAVFRSELTTDIFRLLADGKMTFDEMATLGIKLPKSF